MARLARASLSAGSETIFTDADRRRMAECGFCFGWIERRAPREPHRHEVRMRALPLATPRPSAGLLLTAAVHLACGLDGGRYFHGDITDCALTR